MSHVLVFFFQAEDGIRDRSPSRGLGDVYKRQNDYEMGTFVVECNEEIIHKEDYKTYILRDGDVIEVVQFMGGGCGTSLMYRSIM